MSIQSRVAALEKATEGQQQACPACSALTPRPIDYRAVIAPLAPDYKPPATVPQPERCQECERAKDVIQIMPFAMPDGSGPEVEDDELEG